MNIRDLKTLGAVLLTIFAFGCSEAVEPSDEPLDPENESFVVDGKADSLGMSQDEIDKVLAIANSYSFEELDAFLNARAARSIIYRRDRGIFETLAELDDVPWVGQSALRAFRVEAQTFQGIQQVTDLSEMVEIREVEGRYDSSYQLVFHGQLSSDLQAQPGVDNALTCNEATGSCTFRYRFEDLNDYRDSAEAGHVAVSFRTDESVSDSFRGFARNIERYSSGGPLECSEVENPPRCVSVYGGSCSTPIRCRVRLPEPQDTTTTQTRTEPVVASELVQIDDTDYGLEVRVMGELAEALYDQPGVDNRLRCEDDMSSCVFRDRFDRVNDYIDRAQAGHIAVSFRTDETDADHFRGFAADIERYSNGGPLECTALEAGTCIPLYGGCVTHYRCGIRLPE